MSDIEPNQDFSRRRANKNMAVLALVLGLAVAIFAVTIVKMKLGG
ncbi:MAG: hypothetical protein PHX61_08250 [Alphaproteobacteria bacterium]|nr:hypothetical protein [Alphaproteobacteria bacterium]